MGPAKWIIYTCGNGFIVERVSSLRNSGELQSAEIIPVGCWACSNAADAVAILSNQLTEAEEKPSDGSDIYEP